MLEWFAFVARTLSAGDAQPLKYRAAEKGDFRVFDDAPGRSKF
jgi:hypothetical protein